MEMEEKPNPNPNSNSNSHECPKSWSELPLDLLSSVFERLAFTAFQRGKSVCSSWYSASTQSVPKEYNKIPWLIVFPEKDDDNYCTLFNPDENDKAYKTKDLGLGFAKSVCKATCGSWLLIQDPQLNLYIVNLFTQERFNPPSLESHFGLTKIEPTDDWWFTDIRSHVFWIDEKTKDYVVVCGLKNSCVVYAKKGDTSWKKIPEARGCYDMVYKDHKLYFLSDSGRFKIFDFSGEFPQETFQCPCGIDVNPFDFVTTKLVVTVTGDVLKVEMINGMSFCIYKVCSSDFLEKGEQVDSLGDETMLFDLGITLLASDIDGFSRNTICYNIPIYLDGRLAPKNFSFNLKTQKMERLCNFDHLSYIQLSKSLWLLPSFMLT